MPDHLLIPALCRNTNLLRAVVFIQLVVLAVWLIASSEFSWQQFGMWSLYVQWIVLGVSLCLCYLRDFIFDQSFWLGVLIVFTVSLGFFLAAEYAVYWYTLGSGELDFNVDRFLRMLLVFCLCVACVVRYFVFLAQLESQNQAEAQSRIHALQSRIQPHFLFNSLNTIAELTRTDAEQAEQAIHALAVLFRVSLERQDPLHSLHKEIDLCKRYIQLEQWRYSKRVAIVWDVEVEEINKWQVPKLILQPLLENAIKYSNESGKLSTTATIDVSIKEMPKHLSLRVTNPIVERNKRDKGHGIAVDNIRERLFVLYDDDQSFRIKSDRDQYQLTIRIPKKS